MSGRHPSCEYDHIGFEQDDGAGPTRIVNIGGGFAGLAAAQALEGAGARKPILDSQNHH